MKYLNHIILLFSLTAVALSATPDEIVDKFIEHNSQRNFGQAIDGFFASNPFSDRLKDDLDRVKVELAALSDGRYGKFISATKVSDVIISEVLREQVYVFRFERSPIRYRFMFYKPNAEWIAHTLSFDHDMDEDLKKKSDRIILSVENK